jgi:hypothetical protein
MTQSCDSRTLTIGFDRNIRGLLSSPGSSFTATVARLIASGGIIVVLLSNVMISAGKSIEGH